MSYKKAVFIGTGNIARTHAAAVEAAKIADIHGVFDVHMASAERFAADFGIPNVYSSVEAALASSADVFHILTPPDYHLESALPFVEAGKTVLIEKPIGVSTRECDQLLAAASISGSIIGVNQNFVYNPAFLKLRRAIDTGQLGPPRYVDYLYEAPLRQLAARQFSHWMFRQPVNILLEQAVHPLSQIVDVAGQVEKIHTQADPAKEISPGVGLYESCQVSMQCARMPAHLHFRIGAKFTVCRMTVVCDDGVAIADIFANQFHTIERGAYMEPIDNWLAARKSAKQISCGGFSGLRDYALSTIKLKPRSDTFFLGMKNSIDAFYSGLNAGQKPRADLEFGAHLVSICEKISAGFEPIKPLAKVKTKLPPSSGSLVTVLGGTGFIGSHTVEALLQQGYRIRVMARGIDNLRAIFQQPGVEVIRGDVKSSDDLGAAITGASYVINLAHGGGGSDLASIRAAMVDTAVEIARISQVAGVKRLLHVGSIASLYLGDAEAHIVGSSAPDPAPETRNDYAHAKALADMSVLGLHKDNGLSVVVLRPGLVVGEGTSPFHSGLGIFNNDQYCIGWNRGTNPLPWVLAADCAAGIVAALTADRASGRAYNLVGDVRLSAREYLQELATATERPLQFVPSLPTALWITEMGKWIIKRVAGQKVSRPYKRDILSRGLLSQFDCSDARNDLNWHPVADRAEFRRQAFADCAE